MANMSRKPHVTLAHCSVGCNQLAECLDWGAQGLIAYGAHNQAVVYDPEVPATCHDRFISSIHPLTGHLSALQPAH